MTMQTRNQNIPYTKSKANYFNISGYKGNKANKNIINTTVKIVLSLILLW